ncbi:hypothetical protein KKC04_04530 [Patescibacteria group bacterium]|nr:hypothetical protein [Patescibacteria group bacterium]
MNYQFSYLIGDLTILIIWFVLFFWRKDTRKEMLSISLIFGLAGLIVEFIYTIDWWHPLTITNTLIGIEDFIFGFAVGGVASIIYLQVFKKRLKIKKADKKTEDKKNINFLIIISTLLALFLGSFFVLKFNSFYSSIIAFTIPTLIIWFKRKDLILDSIASGFILMVTSFLFFIIPELITPGWVNSAWFIENLSGIIILKVPLEDIIWFFLAGAFIGPLYEYWQEGKLINLKN